MAKTCSFVEVPINTEDDKLQLKTLADVLNNDLPISVQFLNIIQLILQERYYSNGTGPYRIFRYDETGSDSGDKYEPAQPLFLVFFVRFDEKEVVKFLYCRGDPTPEMQDAFTKLIDWSEFQLFGTVNLRLNPFLEKAVKAQRGNMKVEPNWTMYLPNNKWASVAKPTPADVKVQKLSSPHGQIVNKHWKFADGDRSLGLIEKSIKHFISAGVFLNNPECDDQEVSKVDPVSWIISLPMGTLNALHTAESHRRKGYANLTMREAARQAAEMGIYPVCEVEYENANIPTASKVLLKKIGFEVAFLAGWFIYKPEPVAVASDNDD